MLGPDLAPGGDDLRQLLFARQNPLRVPVQLLPMLNPLSRDLSLGFVVMEIVDDDVGFACKWGRDAK